MQPVLLVIQFLLAIALIGAILIQKTAQDGGGLTGGGNTMGGLFTARGSANLLTRTTAVLATLFILNSLTLGFIASNQHREATASKELIDSSIPTSVPAPGATTQPVVPSNARPDITTTTEKPAAPAKPPAAKKTHPKPAPEKAPAPEAITPAPAPAPATDASPAPAPDASAPAPEQAPASDGAPEVPMAH